MMTLRGLRLLPALVIARVGSSETPFDNYSVADDPGNALDFRAIVPAETLVIDATSGEVVGSETPTSIAFKDGQGRIKPVAPFLEVFALVSDSDGERLVPLGTENLPTLAPGTTLEWRIHVANRKAERRTGDPDDRVEAAIDWFGTPGRHRLLGTSANFVADAAIDFGDVRYVTPNDTFKEFRLRFTPGKGVIYGPAIPDGGSSANPAPGAVIPPERAIYDTSKGRWFSFQPHRGILREAASYGGTDPVRLAVAKELERLGFAPKDLEDEHTEVKAIPLEPDPGLSSLVYAEVERLLAGDFFHHELKEQGQRMAAETMPPSLYANAANKPPWLNDGKAVSRGFLDDICDGIVEVRLRLANGDVLHTAQARVCSAPPAVVPDSLFVRTLADDLDQALYGPDVPADEPPDQTKARALDTIRRAAETVRFLNVAVANGNRIKPDEDPEDYDTMVAEEAFQTERLVHQVFKSDSKLGARSPDTLSAASAHQGPFNAVKNGVKNKDFAGKLRTPDRVTDYTNEGRRKMPALMCGADGSYLALTHRQINTVAAAQAQETPYEGPIAPPEPDLTALRPRNVTARQHQELHHRPRGNPFSSTPATGIGNCTPGLELDLRAVWRRLLVGIVLREYDNLVVAMDPDFRKLGIPDLTGHRLLALQLPGPDGFPDRRAFVHTMGYMIGPSPAELDHRATKLVTAANPTALAPLEWSNVFARVLHDYGGKDSAIRCLFTEEQVWESRPPLTSRRLPLDLKVRAFFEGDTAVISRVLAEPGELTQGLCSPWQNDYRECSCYYWASARPDYVNVVPDDDLEGASKGDNWLQKERTGDYVPDTYEEPGLISYDDLFADWEKLVRFQVRRNDAEEA